MRGTARDPQPAAVLIADILSLADRLRQHLEAPCLEQGVSASRFALLDVVDQSGSGGMAQTELAARLGLSESNVSVLVEALRKNGLLHRMRSKVDRRRSVLLLSESGQQLVMLLSSARTKVSEALLEGIRPEQISNLRSLLAELDQRLHEPKSRMTYCRPQSPETSLRRAS